MVGWRSSQPCPRLLLVGRSDLSIVSVSMTVIRPLAEAVCTHDDDAGTQRDQDEIGHPPSQTAPNEQTGKQDSPEPPPYPETLGSHGSHPPNLPLHARRAPWKSAAPSGTRQIEAHMVSVSYGPCRFLSMPIARITVTAVSDEGDNVIVWGRTEHATEGSEPVGCVFQTKGPHADIGLAERASRMACGTEAVIEYVPMLKDWNVARGMSSS